MKLWLATYQDDDSSSGTVQLWATSERKVRAKLAEVKAMGPANFTVYNVQQITVPTTREALAEFLNVHADAA